MTAPRNPDALVRAFLADHPELPEHIFVAVRRDIHSTRQRVVIGPLLQPDATTLARLAIAAAIVVAVGLAWIGFGPRMDNIGGPTPAPTATDLPTLPREGGALKPGRYRMYHTFAPGAVPGTRRPATALLITVPLGWLSHEGWAVDKAVGPDDAEAGPALVVWEIKNRFEDPCSDHTLLDPPPGPDIDDLVEALGSQPGIAASTPAEINIDGYLGRSVELTVSTEIDACNEGFWMWGDPTTVTAAKQVPRYAHGMNDVDRVYVLDVDGRRFTFFARIPAGTTPADRAELEAILASIEIEP